MLDFLRVWLQFRERELEAAVPQLFTQHIFLRYNTVKGENKPSYPSPDLYEICPLSGQFISICSLCIYTSRISDCLNSAKKKKKKGEINNANEEDTCGYVPFQNLPV